MGGGRIIAAYLAGVYVIVSRPLVQSGPIHPLVFLCMNAIERNAALDLLCLLCNASNI